MLERFTLNEFISHLLFCVVRILGSVQHPVRGYTTSSLLDESIKFHEQFSMTLSVDLCEWEG